MKPLRLPLAPSLALLACATWAPLAQAATEVERDQQFIAIRTLVGKELRLPADREIAAFKAAGYSDPGGWFAKAVDFLYADRFQAFPHLPKERIAALAQLATELKDLPEQAGTGAGVPTVIKETFTGANSPLMRMVNSLANEISPNVPPPLLPPERISKDKKEALNRQVVALIAQLEKDLAKSMPVVAANQEAEKGIWELDDKAKAWQNLVQGGVERRLTVINQLYFSHLVLGEVITRGHLHGIEAAPAVAFYRTFLDTNKKELEDWDYNWGTYDVQLRQRLLTVMSEGVRLRLKEFSYEDVDRALEEVYNIPLKDFPKEFHDEVTDIKIKGFTSAMLLAVGVLNAVDRPVVAAAAAAIKDDKERKAAETASAAADKAFTTAVTLAKARGKVAANAFKTIAAKDTTWIATTPNGSRAMAVGEYDIAAARFFLLANEASTWRGLLAEVAGARTNALSVNAGAWLSWMSAKGGGSGGEWGSRPTPEDPTRAMAMANAFLREGANTADPVVARGHFLSAACALRNGVLGVSDVFADRFVTNGPEVYERYANSFYKMGQSYHAAIAGVEGMRAVAARITDKQNPWKDAKGNWNPAGLKMLTLVKSTGSYVRNLRRVAPSSGVGKLYIDYTQLSKAILGADATPVDELKVAGYELLKDNKFDEALASFRDLAKTYPDEYFWALGALVDTYQRKLEDIGATLRKDPKSAPAKADFDKTMAELAKTAETGLKAVALKRAELATGALKDLPPTKKTEWARQLDRTQQSLEVVTVMGPALAGQHDVVLKQLGPAFWVNPPTNDGVKVRMLRYLAQAVEGRYRAATVDDAGKKDPQRLLEAWATYEAAGLSFKKASPTVKDEAEAAELATPARRLTTVFQSIGLQVDWFRKNLKDAPGQLEAIGEGAKRLSADLAEPYIDDKTPAARVLAIADVLWQLGDHDRAGPLYITFRDKVSEGTAITKDLLDETEAALRLRPELAESWKKARDLLEDKPQTSENWRNGTPRSQLGEEPIDFGRATSALRALHADIDAKKSVLGDSYSRLAEAVGKMDQAAYTRWQDVQVKRKLARYYAEIGDKAKARSLYSELYNYNPDDPDNAQSFVEAVLDAVRTPQDGIQPNPDELKKAMNVAASARERAENDRNMPAYWGLSIQILELSAAEGKAGVERINRNLKYSAVNRSNPSTDLVRASPIGPDGRPLDDRRVRRPANREAVELAQRYLKIYDYSGVTEKPSFRLDPIDGVDAGMVFVDVGAPPAVASTIDDEVVFRYPDTPAIGAAPVEVATSTTASATAAAPAASTTPAAKATP